jgi:hypothetical protein
MMEGGKNKKLLPVIQQKLLVLLEERTGKGEPHRLG